MRLRHVPIALLLLFAAGCAEYRAGECVQNSKDGYIYRVTAVSFVGDEYTVQGWLHGKWGIPVEAPASMLRGRYVKVGCPFSTEVLQEK